MNLDMDVLERWLIGWSLARGLPLPTRANGGLIVDVGWPEQLRRHVFLEAGSELRECADLIHEPFIYLKAAVDPIQMRLALPSRWQIESPRYLMYHPAVMAGPVAPSNGYIFKGYAEHGAHVIRLESPEGAMAATGRVVLTDATAIFDRIETFEPYRRRGFASALMRALDSLAQQAGVSERLLVATEAGRALYLGLGWRVLAPWSTAVLPA
jgi:GNAT superfamily N-acetyltransferase